jgi:hypothetical protein
VRRFRTNPILAWSTQEPQGGEAAMALHRKSGRNRRAQIGAVLLIVGILLMLTNLGLVAASLPHFLASLGVEALGAPAAAALALLKFFRTLAFHPTALLPFVCGILVVFFALAGILSGLMLLRRRRTVENA